MTAWLVLQNLALLNAATGLAVYFRTPWAFLLLLFWLSPKQRADSDEHI